VTTTLLSAQVSAQTKEILLETDRLIEESRKLRRQASNIHGQTRSQIDVAAQMSLDDYGRNPIPPEVAPRLFEIKDGRRTAVPEVDPEFQPAQEEDPSTMGPHLNSWSNEGAAEVASFEAIMFMADGLKRTRVGQDWNTVATCPICRQDLFVTYKAAKDLLWLECATAGCVDWMDHVPKKGEA
jgi:hypothetical protein